MAEEFLNKQVADERFKRDKEEIDSIKGYILESTKTKNAILEIVRENAKQIGVLASKTIELSSSDATLKMTTEYLQKETERREAEIEKVKAELTDRIDATDNKVQEIEKRPLKIYDKLVLGGIGVAIGGLVTYILGQVL